jgi:hypothetical protein
MSNLQHFTDGGKELYMIPFDSFISANIPKFKDYIDNISASKVLSLMFYVRPKKDSPLNHS